MLQSHAILTCILAIIPWSSWPMRWQWYTKMPTVILLKSMRSCREQESCGGIRQPWKRTSGAYNQRAASAECCCAVGDTRRGWIRIIFLALPMRPATSRRAKLQHRAGVGAWEPWMLRGLTQSSRTPYGVTPKDRGLLHHRKLRYSGIGDKG